MNLTQYEYTMMHLTGVCSSMIAGWSLSKDVIGIFLAELEVVIQDYLGDRNGYRMTARGFS